MLVTGPSGAIGPRIVEALHAAGYSIRTLSRRPPSPGILPATADVLLGDVTDAAAATQACRDVDTVFHLAALLHGQTGAAFERSAYEAVNVGGTRTMMAAAVKAGVRRFVLFSTVAVYGPGSGDLIDEDSTVRPDTPYTETKLAAEHIVLHARDAGGRAIGTVLRLAAVYGIRVKGNYQRLVRALAHGRFVPIGRGQNRRTLVYDRDVAQAALLTIDHAGIGGKIFNVTDGEVHTVAQITSAICMALSRRPPRFSVPVAPMRLCAGVADSIFHLAGRPTLRGRETIDKYLEDIAVSSQRIQRDLGFSPRYGLLAGWQEAIAEIKPRSAS